jgi:TrmH family RNA methyltransferase
MITSLTNAKVKHVRSLSRRRMRYAEREFVLEGVRLVDEAMGAGITPALVFYSESAGQDSRAQALLNRLRARTDHVFDVTDAVMRSMSNEETPPGILAVVPFVELPIPAPPGLVLILDSVRDPGNVGTILRAARAAGVDLVLFAPGTADPYNEKVVRAAMGAHFWVPLRVMPAWEQIASILTTIPRVYLADARGELNYTRADWSRPVALIVGGEAEGASAEAQRLATARVSIPMRSDTESLNAAMAATLLLFEARRTYSH